MPQLDQNLRRIRQLDWAQAQPVAWSQALRRLVCSSQSLVKTNVGVRMNHLLILATDYEVIYYKTF